LNRSMLRFREKDNSIFADVLVKKGDRGIRAEFMFYRDLRKIVSGKEIKGSGKNPVVIGFPKINGVEMRELVSRDGSHLYSAEIENPEKEYTVTFRRKDGEYQAIIRLNPDHLSQPVKARFKRKTLEQK
jgi:hypothetical protein